MTKKLAIIATHPIQYQAPLFRILARRADLEIRVFFTWSQAEKQVADAGFGRTVQWDIPLLEGYPHEFVPNVASGPRRSFRGLRNPELISRIEAWGANALLVHGWNYASHLNAMRHFHGRIPVYFRGDSHSEKKLPLWRGLLRKLLLRRVYHYADYALYVGSRNRDYFREFGMREFQLVFMPHAIDNPRFGGTPEDAFDSQAAAWRKELGISEQDMVLLYAGKFQKIKNLEWLTTEFVRFKAEGGNPAMKLLLAGNGEEEERLKQLAAGRNDILFLPFQNQSKMPILYRLGDVTLLVSHNETWGLCVNESMACGRPVLISDHVGCAVDLVTGRDTGWCFPGGSGEAFRKLLADLTPSALCASGERARNFIQSWSFEYDAEALAGLVNARKKVMALFPYNMKLYGAERGNLTVLETLSRKHYQVYALLNNRKGCEDAVDMQAVFDALHIPWTQITAIP